jgi:hypothetical protein
MNLPIRNTLESGEVATLVYFQPFMKERRMFGLDIASATCAMMTDRLSKYCFYGCFYGCEIASLS